MTTLERPQVAPRPARVGEANAVEQGAATGCSRNLTHRNAPKLSGASGGDLYRTVLPTDHKAIAAANGIIGANIIANIIANIGAATLADQATEEARLIASR